MRFKKPNGNLVDQLLPEKNYLKIAVDKAEYILYILKIFQRCYKTQIKKFLFRIWLSGNT